MGLIKKLLQDLKGHLVVENGKFYVAIGNALAWVDHGKSEVVNAIVVEIDQKAAQSLYLGNADAFIEIDCHRLPSELFSKDEAEVIYERFENSLNG